MSLLLLGINYVKRIVLHQTSKNDSLTIMIISQDGSLDRQERMLITIILLENSFDGDILYKMKKTKMLGIDWR